MERLCRVLPLLLLAVLSLGIEACGKVRWVENVVILEPLPGGVFWIEALTEGSAEPDDPEGQRRVRDFLDRVDGGRDPWMVGLRRAGARGVYVEAEGLDTGWRPEGPVTFRLHRGGEVARSEDLGTAFPDPVFEFRYFEDPDAGTGTLEMFPVDYPREMRENQRRIARALRRLAEVLSPRLDAMHAIYRGLERDVDGRMALLGAADAWSREDVETPPPSVRQADLVRALEEADEALDEVDLEDPEEPITVLFAVDQSPVGGRLGVRLPPAAVREVRGFEDGDGPDEFLVTEPKDVLEAIESLDELFEPPWDDIDGLSEEEIAATGFHSRYDMTRDDLADLLWREMTPQDLYRIVWDLRILGDAHGE